MAKRMKILTAFYGIGRGLELSEPSILSKLLKPLTKLGCNVSSIYVLNEIEEVNNERSGDFGSLQKVPAGVFNNAKIIRKQQADLLDNELYEMSMKYYDAHNDNYKSNKNLICQLSMLELAERSVDFSSYDRVILCRDDIFFSDNSIDWKAMLEVSGHGPVVSMWHWHNGIGERFVLASSDSARLIARRKQLIHDYFDTFNTLNAEFLQYFCFFYHSLTPYACNIKLARSRLNGRLEKERYILPLWRPREFMRMMSSYFKFKSLSMLVFKKNEF